MTKRHRKQNMLIQGVVDGVAYTIEQETIDHMRDVHGVDAVKIAEDLIRQETKLQKDKNEN
jgi:hypothetical protein